MACFTKVLRSLSSVTVLGHLVKPAARKFLQQHELVLAERDQQLHHPALNLTKMLRTCSQCPCWNSCCAGVT